MKCNFLSAQLYDQYVVGKFPSSNVKFNQDSTEDKKIMAFDNSGTKVVACDHPEKGVNYHLSSPEFDKPYVVGKLSILEA